MSAISSSPTRVLLVCSGLEHARRGFESFARECFEALRGEPELDLTLIKGSGGPAPAERSIPTLRRDTAAAQMLARIWGREPFRVEQVAFGAGLLPLLARKRPDVVYFSEWHTGLVLSSYRRLTRQRVRLVLCNGAMAVERFGHLDRVQQLTPVALEAALERDDQPARHVLLPLGFSLPQRLSTISAEERSALRSRLRLPAQRKVILSAAALNRSHKRLDYLIEEVASLPCPRPFLLLAGQEEAETPEIRALAAELLGQDGHDIRTASHREMVDLYRASDVFVLASLGEGLPRALIEALGLGLPCLAHDYTVTRYALGPYGEFGDFSAPGGLVRVLSEVLERGTDADAARRRHRFAYESFAWERLRPRYVRLLQGRPLREGQAAPASPSADQPAAESAHIH